MKNGIKKLGILIVLCISSTIGFSQNDSIIFSITKPLCYGDCNGSILASVSGTNAPYSFLWSNGATTNSITGLCASDYTLSVTNSNSIITTSTISLPQPFQLLPNFTFCGLGCNWGTFTPTTCINTIGGTLPYQFTLVSVTNSTITAYSSTENVNCFNMPFGAYDILISDSNNCQASLYGNFIILDSTNCNTTFSSPTCSTCCDGVVQLNFINPCPSCSSTLYQAGITYTSSTNTFTNVCLGSYTITATNFECSSIFIDTLHRPTSIYELTESKDFCIFPNPSNGIIKAKYNEGVDRIKILNYIGTLVKEIDTKNTITVNIDLSILAKGIYLVEFIDKENLVITHKKILLE